MIFTILYFVICIVNLLILWRFSKIEYFRYVVDISSTCNLVLAYTLAIFPYLNVLLLCVLIVGIIETKCLRY